MLNPVQGCLVRLDDGELIGEVVACRLDGSPAEIEVRWSGRNGVERIDVRRLASGFMLRAIVREVPRSPTRESLGVGEIVETRRIGGRTQHLVEFPDSGERVWLPYENLRFVRGARQRFLTGQAGNYDTAERFRLKMLAWAIATWHENTGALSRLNIDPLPHQIHLVHRILKSGNLNWMIADDVGLGKTVEVGMLLSALRQRGDCRRVLLVTPAGLVRQWKEEMHHKFGLSEFRIYGEDFFINDERDWKLYDHVIGSMDRLKQGENLSRLMQSGTWDLVVFDEAHRLSRTQTGLKLDASERFQLARRMRSMTDSIVLLTATPHQGKQDKFQALLELLRPEWRRQIMQLSLDASILSRMIIRNNKADVTDADGNFIFQGKITKACAVPVEPEALEFDKALQQYLKKGYAAGRAEQGSKGRAIGFVMTVYRKLAASSAAAIASALLRRLERLRAPSKPAALTHSASMDDERYQGEWEEQAGAEDREFFAGEVRLLEDLHALARRLHRSDAKMRTFIDVLLPQVLMTDPTEKILVFTEYRATQVYLAESLLARFGEGSVSLIHGGMDHQERTSSIERFESIGQFLISTEAGAEGINLQRRCHVMVNFDLPWNPMRLVQRVGRLYRYGQRKKVIVFNMHAPQTIDADVVATLYARVEQVVSDMAPLGGEFRDGLKDEIMGQMTDLLDVEEILESATEVGMSRTSERIEQALASARLSVDRQRELFEHVTGFDATELRGELKISREHVKSFVLGMCRQLGIEVRDQNSRGTVMQLQLPDAVRDRLRMKGSLLRIAFERDDAASAKAAMMDFETPFLRMLIDDARQTEFGGLHGRAAGLEGEAAICAMLRWQDDRGRRIRQEFSIAVINQAGRCTTNPAAAGAWLMEPAHEGAAPGSRERAQTLLKIAGAALDQRLAAVSTDVVHPEGNQLIGCAWSGGA